MNSRKTEVTLAISWTDQQKKCVRIWECHYLHKEDNEKIEVGYPSELLKQILGDKIPYCVLQEKEKTTFRKKTKKRLSKQGICRFQKAMFKEP